MGIQGSLCPEHKGPHTRQLKQKTFLAFSSGGWKPEIRMPAGSGSGESSWFVDASFSLCPHTAEWPNSLLSLLLRALISSWGSPLMASSNTDHLPKGSISKYHNIADCSCSLWLWEGTQFSPQNHPAYSWSLTSNSDKPRYWTFKERRDRKRFPTLIGQPKWKRKSFIFPLSIMYLIEL